MTVAAGLLAYRGRIVGYVVEKWKQRNLPTAVSYSDVAKVAEVAKVSEDKSISSVIPSLPAQTGASEESPANVGIHNPSQPPLTLGGGELIELPAEFNLAVPFTSQAPYADWNLPYKEACEEASVAMVDAFYTGRTFNQASATTEILSVVEWENTTFGYYEDTTAEETARILRERYGYKNVRVVADPTVDMIKCEIAQGRPVILPAAGQLLGNRYFRQPGPVYHMLVVRGWTKDGMIITNDPGTKRGEGYLYKPETLMNAVHDWNGGDMYNGRKVMIVVEN